MNDKLFKESMQKIFASLGDSLDDTLNYLRAEKIKGAPRSCYNCPIANLIKRELKTDNVRVGRESVREEDLIIECDIPDHVQWFILRFDGNEFPDLIS